MLTRFSHWSARFGPAGRGSLFYLGFYAAGGAYIPFLPVFYADRGLSGGEIGLLSAIGPLTALLVAPALTALGDRRGWRVRLLCLALLGSAFSLLLMPLPASFLGFLPVALILALLGSPVIPLGDGILTRMAARRRLEYGRMRLWGSLGWAVLAAACGALWQEAGFFLMFPLASLLFLVTIPVARGFDEEPPIEPERRLPARVVVRDVRLRVVLVASFAAGLALSMGWTFGMIHLDALGGGQVLVGLFAGITAITELPVMHWSERIVRRIGGPPALLLSYAFLGSGFLGMALIRQPELLLLMAFFQGLGFGLFLPVTVRLVSAWSPAEWSATAQGILSAALWGLAPLIAGPLGGLIFDSAGVVAVFWVSVAANVVAMLVLILAQLLGAFKRTDEYREEARPPALVSSAE